MSIAAAPAHAASFKELLRKAFFERRHAIPLYADLLGFPKDCLRPILDLRSHVRNYATTLQTSPHSARESHARIQAFLEEIEKKHPHCLKSVQGSYISEALDLLLPFDQMVARVLPVYLLRGHRIALVKSVQVDGLERKALASYSCAKTLIEIDITQPPIDLATTLIHEFDHLLRDKFPSKYSSSLRNEVLLDETLANSTAALYQLRAWERLGRPDTDGYDFGFFTAKGPTMAIWETYFPTQWMRRVVEEKGYIFFKGLTEFGVDPSFKQIIAVISDAYLGEPAGDEFIESIQKSTLTAENSTFTAFISPGNIDNYASMRRFESLLSAPSTSCINNFVGPNARTADPLPRGQSLEKHEAVATGNTRYGVGGSRPAFDVIRASGKHLCIDFDQKL